MAKNDFPRFNDPAEDSPADDINVDDILTKQEEEELLAQRLQSFSDSVAKTRKKYVDGRRASGIEKDWLDAEDAYNSVDGASRTSGSMMDAVAAGYPITANNAKPTRSTVFVGVTRQKTNVAEARIADILLPTDDRNWGIKPTPDPKITKALEIEQKQMAQQEAQQQPPQQPQPDAQQQPAPGSPQPGLPPNAPWSPGQPVPGVISQTHMTPSASKIWAQALAAAEGMQNEINSQLIDCDWNGTQRKVLHNAAVLGVGVVKGPVAGTKIKKAWTPIADANGKTFHVLEIAESVTAESSDISPWNFFPDPSCGDDIHDGGGAMELKFLTKKKVRELAKQPGYLKSQLAKVLEEGPQASTISSDERAMARMRNSDTMDAAMMSELYEMWEYWGEFDREDLLAAGVKIDGSEDILQSYSGCVVMINSTIVKAFLHPMSGGDLPYDVYVWEKRTSSWAGYGVPHLVKWQQRVINSAWRMMMDNAGSTVGSQIVLKSASIQPADKKWEINGRKIWWCTDENADVRQAFATFDFQSHQAEYQSIIKMAEEFMDSESGVPQIAQGEHDNAPDTVGGMQILMASANTVVRRLVKQYDDMITRPHIRRYYDWNMEHNDKPEIKGDFQIDARGSSALVTRDIQNQAYLQMLQLAKDPIYGIYVDPKKIFEKALQAQHIDPAEIFRADDEIAQIEQQQAGKGPTDPKVQAALINAQAHLQVAKARSDGMVQLEQARAQTTIAVENTRAQAEQAYADTEAQMAKDNQGGKLIEMQMKERMLMLDYANKRNLTLEQVKADLAKVAMQENTKVQLAQMQHNVAQAEGERSRTHDVHMHHLTTSVQPPAADMQQQTAEV